jgi:hypothetical protein
MHTYQAVDVANPVDVRMLRDRSAKHQCYAIIRGNVAGIEYFVEHRAMLVNGTRIDRLELLPKQFAHSSCELS